MNLARNMTRLLHMPGKLEVFSTGTKEEIDSLRKQFGEFKDEFESLPHKMAELKDDIDAAKMELTGLTQILENVEARAAVQMAQQSASILRAVLRQRSAMRLAMPATDPDAAQLISPVEGHKSLAECYELLSREAPIAYEIWRRLVDVNEATYEGCPVHSCSVAGHEMAELFACFLVPYLTGTVLDIGCGPQPFPVYLREHPPNHIAGIDPLLPVDPHPFTFVQGICEFLPWEDNLFDLVSIATSFDHVLLIDRALDEIHRVLKPTGHLVIWTSFVSGAAVYDPYGSDVAPVDEYHLFHFDRGWFEELMSKRYVQREMISLAETSGSCFYSFQPA